MTILGVLQNAWFRDPARVQAIYDGHAGDLDRQARLNARYLFRASLSGRRLRDAFGVDLCVRIVWWEASPRIAGRSDGAFPADLDHVRAAIEHFRPRGVVAFGKIAGDAVRAIRNEAVASAVAAKGDASGTWAVEFAPHPAARGADVPAKLAALGELLRFNCPAGTNNTNKQGDTL